MATGRRHAVGSRAGTTENVRVDDSTLAEAHAYSVIAELLDDYRDEIVGDRAVAMQIANVLHSAAIELNAGRALPAIPTAPSARWLTSSAWPWPTITGG